MDKKLKEILDQDNWELKTLGEIAIDSYNGVEITREQLGTGNYPAIKCGDINSKLNICFVKCVSFVDEKLIKNPKYFEYGDILISNLSNKLDTIGTAVAYVGNQKCLVGLGVTVIKHKQNPRYLAYLLSTEYCRKQIEKLTLRGTVFNFWSEKIKKLQIPIPSLETQELVANYLDKFTEMNKQLEAELEERKLQYKHYLNQLIIGRDEEEMKKRWPVKTLGEIIDDIYIGSEIKRDQLNTGAYPSIKSGDINSKLGIQFTECVSFVEEKLIKNPKYFEHGDILISKLGDINTSGKSVTYLGKDRCLLGDGVYAIKHKQNPRYLAYLLSTEYCRKQIQQKAQKGPVIVNLYPTSIQQIQIPVPSLKEQEEIATKLDKFYSLIGDLKQGIPWLIKANKKQYEYYKNQIIKF